MLDRLLPDYLATTQTINGEALDLPALVSSRIYRIRPPQASAAPYIFVGDGHDIDFGQTCGPDLTRELGTFSVFVVGLPALGYAALDPIVDTVVKYLKAVRQQYIPSAIVTPRMWVQCIILYDRQQVEFRSVEGDERPMIGYEIPIRSGYDVPIT